MSTGNISTGYWHIEASSWHLLPSEVRTSGNKAQEKKSRNLLTDDSTQYGIQH